MDDEPRDDRRRLTVNLSPQEWWAAFVFFVLASWQIGQWINSWTLPFFERLYSGLIEFFQL